LRSGSDARCEDGRVGDAAIPRLVMSKNKLRSSESFAGFSRALALRTAVSVRDIELPVELMDYPVIYPVCYPDINGLLRTASAKKKSVLLEFSESYGLSWTASDRFLVPGTGIEPACRD
jgi:hypothetical protein